MLLLLLLTNNVSILHFKDSTLKKYTYNKTKKCSTEKLFYIDAFKLKKCHVNYGSTASRYM